MLRDYQQKAVDDIRKAYQCGHRKVLLHLATGGGKTVVFCHIMKSLFEKGKRAVMIVRGRELVDQGSKRLFREHVNHGVHMAGHWNYKPHSPIQVCSIDTLRARNIAPPADLVVIDEAHMATSESYHTVISKYPKALILGVTATPYTSKSLRHIADEIVSPIGVSDLIDQGYLVPPRYFAPHIPDLSSVKTQQTAIGKDFNQKQLAEVMSESKICGDIVSHYAEIARGRPALVFCVNIAHSQAVAEAFRKAGFRATHADAHTPKAERELIQKQLCEGELDVVSNVGIFCTGVDLPPVSCIIMARPTQSEILFIQQAGRGTRPVYADGFNLSTQKGRLDAIRTSDKSDFILLDHAANVLRHGFISAHREASIDEKTKEKISIPSPRLCPECFTASYAAESGSTCPECGYSFGSDVSRERSFEVVDGKLKELVYEPLEVKVERFIKKKRKERAQRNYKRGWVYWQVVEEFGREVADQFMTKPKVPSWKIESNEAKELLEIKGLLNAYKK